MVRSVFLRLVFTVALIGVWPSVGGAEEFSQPEVLLQQQFPALFKLYRENQAYQSALRTYANQQGFRRPIENLAVVVHEIIHIRSAAHAGYFIDGVYYEPYLRAGAWPPLRNRDVRRFVTSAEQGSIFSVYLPLTPDNTLGNVIDEINAHGHVLEFICRNEPTSREFHVKNLVGHLQLQELYLRVLRNMMPKEYQLLMGRQESRGALITISERAWSALRACGVVEAVIPAQETRYFAEAVNRVYRPGATANVNLQAGR